MLKETKTEENSLKAFAGESQARNKYTYFAVKQKKMDTYKYLKYLKKLQLMKNSMQSCGLNF